MEKINFCISWSAVFNRIWSLWWSLVAFWKDSLRTEQERESATDFFVSREVEGRNSGI